MGIGNVTQIKDAAIIKYLIQNSWTEVPSTMGNISTFAKDDKLIDIAHRDRVYIKLDVIDTYIQKDDFFEKSNVLLHYFITE